jgi:DNA-binding NarL/FixJ family response regulator
VPDRGASAFYGGRLFRNQTQSQGLRSRSHSNPAIVVHFFARESWMARRELTVQRHEEIKRRLAEGRSVREIASVVLLSK